MSDEKGLQGAAKGLKERLDRMSFLRATLVAAAVLAVPILLLFRMLFSSPG